MATSLLPLLLLSSGFGEPPRGSIFGNYDNYGLQRSPYYFPQEPFPPSIFEDRFNFGGGFWPSAWKGFNELAIPNYLDKDGLNLVINVQGYQPNELEVRVITRQVVVRGKHEEELENKDTNTQDTEVQKKPVNPGKALRQFERRFVVPANVDLDKISTTVSTDGILTIRAPFKDVPKQDEGKKVTIEETGKPALKPLEQQPEKKEPVDTNEVKTTETKKVDVEPEIISREPESREDDSTQEVKKTAEENDIDGVSIASVTEESTTPLK